MHSTFVNTNNENDIINIEEFRLGYKIFLKEEGGITGCCPARQIISHMKKLGFKPDKSDNKIYRYFKRKENEQQEATRPAEKTQEPETPKGKYKQRKKELEEYALINDFGEEEPESETRSVARPAEQTEEPQSETRSVARSAVQPLEKYQNYPDDEMIKTFIKNKYEKTINNLERIKPQEIRDKFNYDLKHKEYLDISTRKLNEIMSELGYEKSKIQGIMYYKNIVIKQN